MSCDRQDDKPPDSIHNQDFINLIKGIHDMNAIKSLWASVQGDPVFMRRVNGWLTIFWLVTLYLLRCIGSAV